MAQKYEIFLSYSRRDLEQVKAIKDELEQATGVNCWMDLDGIESGEQFVNVIISAINRSDALLFMMSEASMQSEWALDELDFAKRKKKRIILVAIDNVEMTDKFYFSYHKYDNIDWSNPTLRDKLIRNIQNWQANKIAQEEARRKAEEEARRKAEEEARRKAEEEARRKAEEEARRKAEEEAIITKTLETSSNDIHETSHLSIKAIIGNLYLWTVITLVILVMSVTLLIYNKKSGTQDSIETSDTLTVVELFPADTLLSLHKNRKNKYGFIDKKGKIVISCKWNNARNFKEGLAAVEDNKKKWGFVDDSGVLVITCKWEQAEPFCEGLARVKDKNGRYGYIDKKDSIIIECTWADAYNFKNGWARVVNDEMKWGFIDKTGTIVIPCKWQKAWDFRDDKALVQDQYGNWVYINKKGEKCGYRPT